MPWADLADSKLYYELEGQGPAVLMVPGLGSTLHHWDPIVPDLSRQFSLILPENRGVGRSIAKRTPQSLGDLSADLLELLDVLDVQRAHLIGASFGGCLAQRFAVDHPDRVDKLVLISTAHRFGPYLMQVAQILGQALRRFPFETFLATMGVLGTAPEYFDRQQSTPQGASQSTPRSNGLPPGVSRKAVIQQLRCLASARFDEAEYVITAPTLVVSGEYDALIPNCYARKMSEAIPNSRFVVLRGCGHNPVMEDPDTLIPLLTE
ncbi:MAG TPA: alpha/beta hydrolase, partial [Tepidisphaeraceae bacterium]|nr:alpha/beta hydrolase [Tepidisphaeraceae bacterium]